MARRTTKTVDTEATAPESTDTQAPEVQDNPAPAEATEGNEGTPEQANTETKTDAEPDLSAFKAAMESALEEADDSTGVLPIVSRDQIATAYRGLDGQKAKNLATKLIDEGVRQAIHDSNLAHARSYAEMRDVVDETKTTKTAAPKAPADPKLAYVSRLASLHLALNHVAGEVPEGVDADAAKTEADELVASLTEDFGKFAAWTESTDEDKGEAPEVSAVVKAAFKIATGKAAGTRAASTGGSTYDGPRRDISKHIVEAFAAHPVGHFLKVSEIANFKSTEYPDKPASQGAVSARLFPESGNCTVPGVEPVQKGENQPRGARKIEVAAA